MKTIQDLKEIWNKDKEAFKSKELGGLQTFVADVFNCNELFDLKQGLESTKNEDRNNEFIKENRKNSRSADIVIFYKGNEIVIPVEVERYCNIENGVKQLADYQNDYQKAYGILTDGYEWRFYNNTIYKRFTIEDFFNSPSMIKTFWEDYLKEENYYLNFFEKTEQLKFDFIEETYRVEDNKELFFEDITNLIKRFKDKLGIVGYLQEKGAPNSDKKATEIAYAYFIQFILYKNLVDNSYTYNDNSYKDFKNEFDTRIANIYNCLKNKAYQGITSQIYGISHFISDKLYKPFNKEQEFINQKLQEVLCKADVVLEEITLWLDIIVFIKKYNFSNMKNEIFGYIYENYLKELYEENNKGQYFTDPAVVNFMLDEIGYTTKEIKKLYEKKQLDKLSIIDPSCGSGTFLYSAVYRIVEALFDGTEKRSKEIEDIINNNIFGLDIAEFPLYLAEMNILMRMLPIIFNEDYTNPIDKKIKIFKTQDSISEFMDTGISSKINNRVNEETGQISLFEPSVLDLTYSSYIRDEDDLKEMKESMRPPRRRFDFVIGNPPYIGYNECCKQKMLFTQMKEIQMSNIYGVNLNTVPNRKKSYSPKPNLYSFFIALGTGLLKPNGKICYIIPQTILTSNDLDVLRYYLSKDFTIEKIITFSGKLFIGRGLKGKKPVATSSLIFIVSKKTPLDSNTVEIVNFKKNNECQVEDIINSRGNNKITKKILQKTLFEQLDNWNFITKSETEVALEREYLKNSITIEEYRNTLPNYDWIQFDKGLVFKDCDFNITGTGYRIIDVSNNCKPMLTSFYIDNSNLTIPDGSQGLGIYKNKYKIIASYTNPKWYYSSEPIMIRSNWIIISSEDKNNILLLFSLLNSSLNKFMINYYAKNENEKILIASIKTVKQFIRIPKMSNKNIFIYDTILNQTKLLLNSEENFIKDYFDFANFTIQNIDDYSFDNNNLVLYRNNDTYKLKINDESKIKSIKSVLDNKYKDNEKLINKSINLTELKNLIVIDFDYQKYLKDYIDDLVFILYFNISIDKNIIDNHEKIHEICSKNEYYSLIHDNY